MLSTPVPKADVHIKFNRLFGCWRSADYWKTWQAQDLCATRHFSANRYITKLEIENAYPQARTHRNTQPSMVLFIIPIPAKVVEAATDMATNMYKSYKNEPTGSVNQGAADLAPTDKPHRLRHL
jgi:hypothetical protein